MSSLDHGKNLIIRFQINNPSQLPLIIKRSEIVFGISQERLKYCLADDFPLSPQIPKLVEITMRITEEEYTRYLRDSLVIGVHGILIHTDTGPNKETSFRLEGKLKGYCVETVEVNLDSRGDYILYNVVGGRGLGTPPPLAHKTTPGSAGFRALPRSMAMGGGRMGMGGFRGGSMGGFHGGGMMGGFHGGGGGRR